MTLQAELPKTDESSVAFYEMAEECAGPRHISSRERSKDNFGRQQWLHHRR